MPARNVVERKDLVRGFEVSKGRFVTLTPDEIDALKLESTRTIDIDSFVPAAEIDRLYWDHPYYLVPDGKLAAEPFAVILKAMERAGEIALARIVIADRERIVGLEPRDDIIIATTLRSEDDVREYKSLSPKTHTRAPTDMVTIATKIMKQKAGKFDAGKFEDRYETALRALIKRKQKGQELVAEEEPAETSNVVDLMDALRSSLKRKRKGKTKAPPRRKKAAAATAKKARRKAS